MSFDRLLKPLFAAIAAVAMLAAPVAARDRFAAIPAGLQPLVNSREIAGAVALVASKDKVLHLSAVGLSSLETRRLMRTGDIFWIASMSKPVVGVALGILRDEGKIGFDDPVAKFIPAFAAFKTSSGAPLTLRHLLTHTGGLGEQMTREPHLTLAETAAMAARMPLRYPVGERWSYSTLGIDVLGRVVEVASGMPLDRFLAARIFQPLGMTDTTFWVSPKDMPRYARTYRRSAGGALEPAPIAYLYGTDPTDRRRPPLIGAGLFSTAHDIARLYQMMLNKGAWHGQRILRPATAAELVRKQTGDMHARPGMPWGLAFAIVEDPSGMPGNARLAPGSYGHGGAFGTSSWADPKRGMVYVLMLERAGLPSPDSSAMRIAFMQAATAAMETK